MQGKLKPLHGEVCTCSELKIVAVQHEWEQKGKRNRQQPHENMCTEQQSSEIESEKGNQEGKSSTFTVKSEKQAKMAKMFNVYKIVVFM